MPTGSRSGFRAHGSFARLRASSDDAIAANAIRLLTDYGLALAAWIFSGELFGTKPLGHPVLEDAALATGVAAMVLAEVEDACSAASVPVKDH